MRNMRKEIPLLIATLILASGCVSNGDSSSTNFKQFNEANKINYAPNVDRELVKEISSNIKEVGWKNTESNLSKTGSKQYQLTIVREDKSKQLSSIGRYQAESLNSMIEEDTLNSSEDLTLIIKSGEGEKLKTFN